MAGLPVADSGAEEHRLPGVGVAHPLVEYQHTQEVSEVGHLLKQNVRQKIVDRQPVGIADGARPKAGTKVPARKNRPARTAEFDMHLRVFVPGTRVLLR